jgi:mono/diheme cytochrome c family protein
VTLDVNLVLAGVSVLLFAGLIAFFAYLIAHQEQVEPSGEPETYGIPLLKQHYEAGETVEQPTPYYVAPIPASPDPLEISANLDKKILIGAAMTLGVLGMIGGYFVIQGEASPVAPGKGLRGAAVEHQLRLDVRRGKEVYASLCYDCHGRDGKGGTTPEGKTLPGLPLNQAGNKHETLQADPAGLTARRRLLELTIERGRDKPPGQYDMPTWGRSEGGQLSPWQIKQLVDLIMYGTDEDWADIAHIRQEHDLEHRVAEQIPPPPPVPSGREVAQAYCTLCHAIDSGRPSTLAAAPNLADWIAAGSKPRAENPPLQALAASDPEWLRKWVSNAKKIKPDTAMTPQAATEGGPLSDELLNAVLKFLRGEEK